MKKNLLFALLGSAAFSLSAQSECVSETGFNDNFTDTIAPVDGVRDFGYWTGNNYDIQRNNGDLIITVNKDSINDWSPMGVGFGDRETIDLTGSSLEVSLTNDGAESIEVYFNVYSNNSLSEVITATSSGSLFGGVIGAGSTASLSFDLSIGRKHRWAANSDGCEGDFVGSYCLTNEGFDISKVSAIEMTIIGAGASVDGVWAQAPLENYGVSLHYIKAGTCEGSGDNGGDNGGGDGETNGESCASTTDDGEAEATFYNLIADGLSTTVTCQYDVLRDVKGTKYGALETATLQGESPAKYCGMCVEMTGAKGTDIVRVVDECPDCHEHNTGDTDIDLSPSAFEAIVGDESIGRSSITWKEVSCPWSTPISLMIESGHQWSIQLIVENEVNRIASVEISSDGGSNWDAMDRTVANQWSRGSMSGETKDFRITDL